MGLLLVNEAKTKYMFMSRQVTQKNNIKVKYEPENGPQLNKWNNLNIQE